MFTIRAMPIDAASDQGGESRERSLAIAISVVLHVLLFLFFWEGSTAGGLGGGDVAGDGAGQGVSVDFQSGGEFRQRIDLIAEPTDPPAETIKASANQQVALPSPLLSKIEAVDDSNVKNVSEAAPITAEQGSQSSVSSSDRYSERQGVSSGGGSGKDGLRAAYLAALKAAIDKHWARTGGKGKCSLILKQSIGGSVQSAISTDCELDLDSRRGLEAAALMAQPLPYLGFETVFASEMQLDIYPEE